MYSSVRHLLKLLDIDYTSFKIPRCHIASSTGLLGAMLLDGCYLLIPASPQLCELRMPSTYKLNPIKLLISVLDSCRAEDRP